AIGGTWGCATSNLMRWQSNPAISIPSEDFSDVIARIAGCSRILSIYVHKYFEDCILHFRSLAKVLKKGAVAHYIVGNSKFYDVMVHTELIYADIMRHNGFSNVRVENIRKRSSKKELFEFVVSGTFNPI
ncbi:MAG TPA: SAM-dependent methyltransferase, partial [Verrucomicrobiae bacterium]